MLTAIFRRCSNLFGGHRSPAKRGVHVAHPRLGVPFYFIANQSVLLALVALVLLMASGPAFAQTDYDTDNDNLIDITSLAQLNAIRYDLNGDGTVAAADTMAYNDAFPNAMASMGCAATCTGYELMSNLDFDTNSDDTITVADDYPNWDPIVDPGNDNSGHTAIFEGNGYTISHLTITDRNSRDVGLFDELEPTGIIRNVGIIDANIRSGHARRIRPPGGQKPARHHNRQLRPGRHGHRHPAKFQHRRTDRPQFRQHHRQLLHRHGHRRQPYQGQRRRADRHPGNLSQQHRPDHRQLCHRRRVRHRQ